MLMSTMLMINLFILFMKHPLSMGSMMLIQTIMISMSVNLKMKSSWMSLILMISMISGLLILFMYMATTASNEKFKMNLKVFPLAMTSFVIINLLFLKMMNKMIIKNNYFMEMMNYKNEIIPLSKMFLMENNMLMIMMMVYLLFTMIVSTHLVNIEEGPMRSSKKYE